MKTWFATVRARNGGQDVVEIEAEDRAAVFAELSRRGLSAIRVEESGRGGARAKASARGLPPSLRGAAAGAIVAAGAAIAAYFLFAGGGAEPGGARTRARGGKPARTAVHKQEAPEVQAAATNGTARAEPVARKGAIPEEWKDAIAQHIRKGTNETQWIIPPLAPDDPDNALRTGTAQELGSLLSIEPGEELPPFPYSFLIDDDVISAAAANGERVVNLDGGNTQFLESLKKFKIAVKETDSDAVVAHKEKIAAAQLELMDGIDAGETVNDMIRAAYEFRKRAYKTRTELADLIRESASAEDADVESVKKQLEYANQTLKEQGIKTIPLEEVLPDDYEEETNAGATAAPKGVNGQ